MDQGHHHDQGAGRNHRYQNWRDRQVQTCNDAFGALHKRPGRHSTTNLRIGGRTTDRDCRRGATPARWKQSLSIFFVVRMPGVAVALLPPEIRRPRALFGAITSLTLALGTSRPQLQDEDEGVDIPG